MRYNKLYTMTLFFIAERFCRKGGDFMDVASIQAELHRYYDKLIAGICLIGMDESEPILFVNRGLLDMYHCGDEGEFYRLTGKSARG